MVNISENQSFIIIIINIIIIIESYGPSFRIRHVKSLFYMTDSERGTITFYDDDDDEATPGGEIKMTSYPRDLSIILL